MVSVAPPRVGPCTVWATPDDITTVGNLDVNSVDQSLLDLNLTVATEILWNKSGQQFNGGGCTEIIRPICRVDLLEMSALWWSQFGYAYVPDLISGSWYNFGYGWGFGQLQPPPSMGLVWEGGHRIPRIDLGQYPVTAITEVKIDGAVFDPAKYRLDEWRYMTRTDGNLWPVDQNLLLADTEVGTWSIALGYGEPPPQMGINACAQLAGELTKHCSGDVAKCELPLRVTAVTRQGVTYSVANVMDILNKGGTGLYFIDLFVNTYNPDGLRRPARVLTPDLKPYRRVGSLDG